MQIPLSENKKFEGPGSIRSKKRIVRVIGFGNIYRSDDGIGIRVIEDISRSGGIKDIELIDGGTSGIDLIFYLQNSDLVIIIDAVDAGQQNAGIVVIKPYDIEKFQEIPFRSYSLHDFDLSEALTLAKKIGTRAQIIIIGIKPENTDFGEKLTSEIEKKIPRIISIVRQMICEEKQS
ncbi:MAG: hydrogenase maturation protease [Actinobacteria bacterium]|nr:hydrogenase maturation protease [Actinomycetota bacterium]